jgi:O-antigen ligase
LRKENCEKSLYQYASFHQRLELWRAALHTFKKYPILGVGKGKFQQETTQLAEKGIVIPTITEYKHAHNEVLFMMSEFGIFGLIVLLVFYYGSFIHFYRCRHHLDITIRTAAYMGLVLSVGIIVFGLTEVIFIKVKEIGFFVVMMSLFLGIIASRKRELSSQAKYYMY